MSNFCRSDSVLGLMCEVSIEMSCRMTCRPADGGCEVRSAKCEVRFVPTLKVLTRRRFLCAVWNSSHPQHKGTSHVALRTSHASASSCFGTSHVARRTSHASTKSRSLIPIQPAQRVTYAS
jgi:hypothetical protein